MGQRICRQYEQLISNSKKDFPQDITRGVDNEALLGKIYTVFQKECDSYRVSCIPSNWYSLTAMSLEAFVADLIW